MAETSKSASQSPVLSTSGKPHGAGGRQRVISSCLTCRRRKVKCDHVHPVCGACTRGNHVCTYATDQGVAQPSSGRIVKPGVSSSAKGGRSTDVQARLDRLELLLEQAVSGKALPSIEHHHRKFEHHKQEADSPFSPASTTHSSPGAGISSDNHNGTLLLDEGQSQFVSSMHYALLADEIHDIKALLSDKTPDEDKDIPTRNNLIHLLSLGRAKIGVTLQQLLPQSQQQLDAYLNLYFSNVDPMVRITHRQTLLRKFSQYVQETHPLAWAIFYSVVNSLPPPVCMEKFGENKDDLLARYESAIEISLARENYLTTSSLEVLQGLILWLTCITKEDDMGKAWALLGVTIRIGLSQGLHRDPSLFHSGAMDAVTTELRRRLWCQICHLEYRAAECKGQEPSIRDGDFTTMLPRNIEDDELIDGAAPDNNPYDEEKFTTMTFQLVRFVGMRALRRIVQSTYRLERQMLESGLHGTSGPDPVQELQGIYEHIRIMVNDMHEENERKFLRYVNPQIPLQRLCVGLASLLEWRCYLLFWLRMPRAYRDVVFSDDIRKSIFEKSVRCVETLNGASVDADVARFQWHIGGHAAFQSIMHILSELRNPHFDPPDRQRALRALQTSRRLKETNTTRAWSVIKTMIDKVLSEQLLTQPQTSPSSVFLNSPATTMPNRVVPMYGNQIPPYSYQQSPDTTSYGLPAQQTVSQTQPMQQQMQQSPRFNWDDINFSNIVGDIPQQNPEMPEFDWGFWGDPVNFNDQTNVPFPMDTNTTNMFAPFGS